MSQYKNNGFVTDKTIAQTCTDVSRYHVRCKEGTDMRISPYTNSNQYKAAMIMLNQAWQISPQSRPTSDWQMNLVIKNYMNNFDADGNYIDPTTGIAGMCATRIPISERHKIIDVSEEARQMMFDETKRHFIEENGGQNGRTTRRSEVFQAYQGSVPVEDRLKGTWTLSQYERQYEKAMAEAAKAADLDWTYGMPFDARILDNVTREFVEKTLVSDGVNLSVRSGFDVRI